MSDADQPTKQNKASKQNGSAHAPSLPVILHAQYLKDISFENPHAPATLKPGQEKPLMELDIGLEAHKIEEEGLENPHEVVITLKAEAKRQDKTVFIVEAIYGCVVSIQEGVLPEKIHPMLFIEIPQIIFPFARQAVANVTQQGGYPPLMLSPVDFRGMYLAQYARHADEEDSEKTAQA